MRWAATAEWPAKCSIAYAAHRQGQWGLQSSGSCGDLPDPAHDDAAGVSSKVGALRNCLAAWWGWCAKGPDSWGKKTFTAKLTAPGRPRHARQTPVRTGSLDFANHKLASDTPCQRDQNPISCMVADQGRQDCPMRLQVSGPHHCHSCQGRSGSGRCSRPGPPHSGAPGLGGPCPPTPAAHTHRCPGPADGPPQSRTAGCHRVPPLQSPPDMLLGTRLPACSMHAVHQRMGAGAALHWTGVACLACRVRCRTLVGLPCNEADLTSAQMLVHAHMNACSVSSVQKRHDIS